MASSSSWGWGALALILTISPFLLIVKALVILWYPVKFNSLANLVLKFCFANNFIPDQYVDKNGCLSIFPFNGLDGIFAARLIKND